jgi:hypothetical protein
LAGENVLRTFPEQTGKSGEPDYQVRGGHRLWISPETELTYAPDNARVQIVQLESGAVRLINPATEASPVRKELTLALEPSGTGVTLDHRLINEGPEPLEIAAWAITVLRPGGWEIIPQPPLGSHERDLLPDRVIVPWPYTDLADERWQLGTRFWRLHPRAGGPATKLGFSLRAGWAGYVLPEDLFVKRFACQPEARYPDFGCNFETFSKGEFIELESLSPTCRLLRGESVAHAETWHLFAGAAPAAAIDDAALAEWLQPLLGQL